MHTEPGPAQPTQPNPLASRAAVGYDIVHNDALAIVAPNGTIAAYLSEASAVSPRRLTRTIVSSAS